MVTHRPILPEAKAAFRFLFIKVPLIIGAHILVATLVYACANAF